MNKYNFSNRMKALAGFAIPGESIADIGTDHGFVPIGLLAENIVPFAVMTDINEGPLEKALGNLNRVGISNDKYSLRKGDGLEPVENGEVSTVIIAGMGAETIVDILSWDLVKTKSFKRFVLQPRKKAHLLRRWLNKNGFMVNQEVLVKEDDKICEVMVVEQGKQEYKNDIEFFLPPLMRKEDLFNDFLEDFIRKTQVVVDNMGNSEETKDLVKPWLDRLNAAKQIERG